VTTAAIEQPPTSYEEVEQRERALAEELRAQAAAKAIEALHDKRVEEESRALRQAAAEADERAEMAAHAPRLEQRRQTEAIKQELVDQRSAILKRRDGRRAKLAKTPEL
jgi:hypothetical protein